MRRLLLALLAALIFAVPAAAASPAAQCGPSLPTSPVFLGEGTPNAIDAAINAPSRGTVRTKVLFVDFPDAPGSTTGPADAASAWLSLGARWLSRSSYGRLSLELDPELRWFRMPRPSTDYGIGGGTTYEQHRVYIADAFAAADATVDFSRADLVYVVPPPAVAIPTSPTFRGLRGTFVLDGRDVSSVVTFGRDAYMVGRTVMVHETGHVLGLPDLYAFGGDAHRFVGTWDLMGNIFQPTDFMAWHRLKLGWLDAAQFVCARPVGVTQTVLTPLGRAGGRKAVFVRTGTNSAILVENRRRLGNDTGICDAGLLVYTVNATVATGTGPVRVLGGRPGGCGYGPRSDAPLRPGQRLTVGRTTVIALPASGSNAGVRIVRR